MMFGRSVAAALCAAMLCPLLALAQAPKPPVSAPPVVSPRAEARPMTKTYVPGLEQFMNMILIEHNKLWFAGQARNWPLAAYELGEIKEIMADVQDLVPVFKNLPLADMMDAVIVRDIAGLEKAIDAKDLKPFTAGYDALNSACNSCHQATGNRFIVIKRPTHPLFTDQDYAPH